jgi:hypothetical protein
MITARSICAVTALLLLTAEPAWAQDPHHPAAAPAASQMPGGTMQGGGMGGAMPMMPMMNSDGMMGSGMGPAGMMGPMAPTMGMGGHVEGWLAFLRTELKITDAQLAVWNSFADTMRANAGATGKSHAAMMPQDATLPARLAAHEQMMTMRLQSLQRFREAVAPLYATLSDEQKKMADELLAPHGMM